MKRSQGDRIESDLDLNPQPFISNIIKKTKLPLMKGQQVQGSIEACQTPAENPLFMTFSTQIPQSSISIENLKLDNGEHSQWRLNKLVEDYEELKGKEVPQLAHVTSFELSCIEDYGKQLTNQYVLYVDQINASLSPEELIEFESGNGFDNEQNLLQYISTTNVLCEEDRNTLVSSFETKLETKQIMMTVAESMPRPLLPGALMLTAVIFKKFADTKISFLDEAQLENSIQVIEPSLFKSCFSKLSYIGLTLDNKSCQEEAKKLVSSWVRIMASIVKGIYDSPWRRRQAEEELVDDLKDLHGRKMLKTSQSSKY